MKQIRKSDLKFTGFKLFAAHLLQNKQSFTDAQARDAFLNDLSADLSKALASDTFIHGHRTEAMFGAMVASLGAVKLLKQEDGTDCYAQDEDLQIPDYRIVLESGQSVLVEAKNYHQKTGREGYSIKSTLFEGWKKYANIMNCELKLGVYWSKWGLWSLVPPQFFAIDGDCRFIDFADAMMRNEMYLLGDIDLGVKPPLAVTVEMDKIKSAPTADGENIWGKSPRVSASCNGQVLTDPIELRIAMYVIFHGKLKETVTVPVNNDRQVIVKYEFAPGEDEQGLVEKNGFAFVGTLSSMFSKYYTSVTSDEQGKVPKQIHARITPGALGELVPRDFKSEKLPLWRFTVLPQHASGKEIDSMKF